MEEQGLQIENGEVPYGKPVRSEDIENKDGFSVARYIQDGTAADEYDVFYTAYRPVQVIAVQERHRVAGTDAGDVSCQLEKVPSGTAAASGSTILVTAFDLKGTVNTVVTKDRKDLVSTSARILEPGDSLALKDSGTLTAVKGVLVTVYLRYQGKGEYR